MSTRKLRRLMNGRRDSSQAIMTWRKLAGHDEPAGQALFLRGLASMMDGARIRSLSADDLRTLADQLSTHEQVSLLSGQWCELHDRHQDDPRHDYRYPRCEKWLRDSTPAEDRAVLGHLSRVEPPR